MDALEARNNNMAAIGDLATVIIFVFMINGNKNVKQCVTGIHNTHMLTIYSTFSDMAAKIQNGFQHSKWLPKI